MKANQLTSIATAVASCLALVPFQAVHAQSNAELLKELQSLKSRMAQLERQLQAQQSSPVAMEPEEFNRIRAKVEATEDNTETLGFKGLKISGMIDPTFVYNKGQNTSGFVFLNNFDGRGNTNGSFEKPNDGYAYDNSYFGMAVLDLQKEVESGQKWRLTLAPHKSANSGYNYGSIVHEASVSLPIDGPTTRIIAGQIPDWTGYEYFFSNLQPLVSHNLLFDFTIPSYYSGAGMEFTRGKWISKFIVGNINESRRPDGQKNPGLSFRVDYAKGEFTGFGFAGSHTTGSGRKVTQGEIDGYFIRGNLTMQGQIGVGTAEGNASNLNANGEQMKARWTGLSGLVGYKVTPRMQLVARGDYIWNGANGGGLWGSVPSYSDTGVYSPDGRNGIGLPMRYDSASGSWLPHGDRGVNRYALSLGTNYLISAGHTPNSGLWNTGTWFKTELRLDGATGPVFWQANGGAYKKTNTTFFTSLVFAF